MLIGNVIIVSVIFGEKKMNEFSSIAEYSVKKTRNAVFGVMRILLPIVSIILSAFISNLIVGKYGLVFGLIALAVLLSSSLIFFSIYFRRVDYDYRMIGSEINFSVVFNRRRRKELCVLDVSTLEKIAPYSGKYADEAEKENYDKICDYSSSPSDPYVFYAVQSDEESKVKTLYLFNASEKMLKLIKTYNRRAVINYPNE